MPSIEATTGTKLYLRGNNTTFSITNGNVLANTTCRVKIYGNIMSLLYDEDFNDKVNFKSNDSSCFANFFIHNKILINAENLILPATTLTERCYEKMFYDCSNLTAAPELPATTLAYCCYMSMFSFCTSLTTAPELHVTTLADYCYNYMFNGCSNLNYIKAMFTTTPSNNYTNNWVLNVPTTGTFVKNSVATWNVTGANGIPEGWTVELSSN